jgi:hypothetical protein
MCPARARVPRHDFRGVGRVSASEFHRERYVQREAYLADAMNTDKCAQTAMHKRQEQVENIGYKWLKLKYILKGVSCEIFKGPFLACIGLYKNI